MHTVQISTNRRPHCEVTVAFDSRGSMDPITGMQVGMQLCSSVGNLFCRHCSTVLVTRRQAVLAIHSTGMTGTAKCQGEPVSHIGEGADSLKDVCVHWVKPLAVKADGRVTWKRIVPLSPFSICRITSPTFKFRLLSSRFNVERATAPFEEMSTI